MTFVLPPKIRRQTTYTDIGNADIAGTIAKEQKPAMRDTVSAGNTKVMLLIFMGQ
jgi:hypothetical protein